MTFQKGENNIAKRPEVRKKIREAKLKAWSDQNSIYNSKEHRKNMSECKKGKHYSPSTEFKKGQTSAFKGKKHTEENKKILSDIKKRLIKENIKFSNHIYNLGFKKGQRAWNKNLTKEIDERVKEYAKKLEGVKFSELRKRNISLAHLGKKASKETRLKLSIANIGEKNSAWLGGISKLPYPFEFDTKLKEQIRERDNHRCQQCFRHQNELKGKLHIHHIDFDKQNINPNNLISLCNNCHSQTQFNREQWTNYFQERLESG